MHLEQLSPLYEMVVDNSCQISYAPPEILFEITEISKILKNEIKKIGMIISKI